MAEMSETTNSVPIRVVVAKPGLDGHDRGAKVVARALRDAGCEVIYTGLHQSPEQIIATALQEDVQAIGLSILSGSHMQLVPDVVNRLRAEGVDAPVIVGGIIPEEDRDWLLSHDVAAVYTPKDFDIARIMREVAELAAAHRNN